MCTILAVVPPLRDLLVGSRAESLVDRERGTHAVRANPAVPGSARAARQLTPQVADEKPCTCTVRCMLHKGRLSSGGRLGWPPDVPPAPLRAARRCPSRSGCSCPCCRTARRSQSRIEEKRAQIEREEGHASASSRPTIQGYTSRHRHAAGRHHDAAGAPDAGSRPTSTRKRAELARIQDELRQERVRLVAAARAAAESRAALSDRLVELYKADKPDVVTVILDSDGFADLLERDRVHAAGLRAGRADHRPRPRAKADAVATERRLDTLEERQREVTAIVARRDQSRRRSRTSSSTRAAARRTCARQAPGARLDAAPTATSSRTTSRRSRRSRPRSRRGSPARRAAARARSAQGSGQLIWPVNGPITSPFGECAGAACTPASTSPRPRARRSAPPTPARVVLAGLDRRLRQLHLHPARRRRCPRATRTSRASARRSGASVEQGPGHRLRRQHRPLVRRRTCTSRCASTARPSTRWATSSPRRYPVAHAARDRRLRPR